MSVKENCTLPENGNVCGKFNCSSCGWDRNVLAARKAQMAAQGLTRYGEIECLVLKRKENADEETELKKDSHFGDTSDSA